jgi:hypothetical protein
MPKNTLKTTAGILAVAVLALGAAPAISAAQNGDSFGTGPTSHQYDPSTITFSDDPSDPADPGDPSGGLNNSVGPLPFTGFDVIAMLAVALAVTGLGLALQRAVSREPRDLR